MYHRVGRTRLKVTVYSFAWVCCDLEWKTAWNHIRGPLAHANSSTGMLKSHCEHGWVLLYGLIALIKFCAYADSIRTSVTRLENIIRRNEVIRLLCQTKPSVLPLDILGIMLLVWGPNVCITYKQINTQGHTYPAHTVTSSISEPCYKVWVDCQQSMDEIQTMDIPQTSFLVCWKAVSLLAKLVGWLWLTPTQGQPHTCNMKHSTPTCQGTTHCGSLHPPCLSCLVLVFWFAMYKVELSSMTTDYQLISLTSLIHVDYRIHLVIWK